MQIVVVPTKKCILKLSVGNTCLLILTIFRLKTTTIRKERKRKAVKEVRKSKREVKKDKKTTDQKKKRLKENENKVQLLFDMQHPVECILCRQKFSNHIDFGYHSKDHNKEGLYACHFCEKKVYKKDHFKRHIMSHNGYKCEVCEKVFKRKPTALYHLHSWEKFYKCEFCGKTLGSSWSLNSHINTVHHEALTGTPSPKFQCEVCKKHYLYESGLKLHYSSQHKEMGFDFSVICDICGRRISCKSKLKQHMRIHSGDRPYACTLCPRKFTTKDLLGSHMRTHTGEKPYMCMYCGKEFAQGAPYRYHIKIHTGEKSFSCPICEKKFISRGNMKIHLKSCNIALK